VFKESDNRDCMVVVLVQETHWMMKDFVVLANFINAGLKTR